MHFFDQVKTNLLYVCEDLEHDPDLERVQKFELMARNFWMSLKFMECQLCITQETVCQILSDCLGRSKFCPEFVLHILRDEQKEPRVTDCEDFVQTSPVIALDKSWEFRYNYETECQRMEWKTESSLRPKYFYLWKLIKMMITFFGNRVCTIKNSCLEEKMWKVNSGLLGRLLKWILQGRPQFL